MTRRNFALVLLAAFSYLTRTVRSLAGELKDDEEIDIEKIKKDTVAALKAEHRDQLDTSYITVDLIKKYKKEAKKAENKSWDSHGNEIESKKKPAGDDKKDAFYAYTDYGNHYAVYNGMMAWQKGDQGTVASYACGQKYVREVRAGAITPMGSCGSFGWFKFEWS